MSPPPGSPLPLPVAAQTPNGSKASLSCQGHFGKWCCPIGNGYSFFPLYGGLSCTGICVSPVWLCGPLVCTQSRAAVLLPLHANELSCSGSKQSRAGGLSCELRAAPKTGNSISKGTQRSLGMETSPSLLSLWELQPASLAARVMPLCKSGSRGLRASSVLSSPDWRVHRAWPWEPLPLC